MNKENMRKLNYTRLFNQAVNLFEWKNLPDTIPARNLEKLLIEGGAATITEVGGHLYAFPGVLGGEPDIYLEPSVCIVANPRLEQSLQLKRDVECVYMRNDSSAAGLRDLLQYYADMQTEINTSIRSGLITSRATMVMVATKDREYDSLTRFMEELENGKLNVVRSSFMDDAVKIFNANNNTNFEDLVNLDNYYKAELCETLNISRSNIRKNQYVNSLDIELQESKNLSLIQDMFIQRVRAVKKLNLLYGLDIEVKIRGEELEEKKEEKEEKTPLPPKLAAIRDSEEEEKEETKTETETEKEEETETETEEETETETESEEQFEEINEEQEIKTKEELIEAEIEIDKFHKVGESNEDN